MYAAQWNVYVVLFKKIYFKNLYIFLRLFKACLYEFSSCDLKISIIGIYFKYTWHCAVQCLWSCGNMTRKLEVSKEAQASTRRAYTFLTKPNTLQL